jgi:hypothetical protein
MLTPLDQRWSLTLATAPGCIEYAAGADGATCHGMVKCSSLGSDETVEIINGVMRHPFIRYPDGQRGVNARKYVARWIWKCCSELNDS